MVVSVQTRHHRFRTPRTAPWRGYAKFPQVSGIPLLQAATNAVAASGLTANAHIRAPSRAGWPCSAHFRADPIVGLVVGVTLADQPQGEPARGRTGRLKVGAAGNGAVRPWRQGGVVVDRLQCTDASAPAGVSAPRSGRRLWRAATSSPALAPRPGRRRGRRRRCLEPQANAGVRPPSDGCGGRPRAGGSGRCRA